MFQEIGMKGLRIITKHVGIGSASIETQIRYLQNTCTMFRHAEPTFLIFPCANRSL